VAQEKLIINKTIFIIQIELILLLWLKKN